MYLTFIEINVKCINKCFFFLVDADSMFMNRQSAASFNVSPVFHTEQHVGFGAGEKKFRHSCKICPYQTDFITNLKRHSRVHSRERPYVCSICNKSFTQKVHLMAHLIIHNQSLYM